LVEKMVTERVLALGAGPRGTSIFAKYWVPTVADSTAPPAVGPRYTVVELEIIVPSKAGGWMKKGFPEANSSNGTGTRAPSRNSKGP
jgi:hypothetical protein